MKCLNYLSTLIQYGEMVMKYWDAIPSHIENVGRYKFVAMPNHIHGTITVPNVGAQFIAPSYVDWRTSHRSKINQKNDRAVINQGVINHAPTIQKMNQ
ncbi:MAG: hypothetical protein EPN86_03035 [Nanoarchaeota archaeon]|nr:MAG: hypothetical protein EPN86_03035 [Nanoarchaeota archaeon]